MAHPGHETVQNETFLDTTVMVDGKHFARCTFNGATLVYGGGALPAFDHCTFNNIRLQFADKAANTLEFLSGLHRGGFPRAVNRIAANIRQQAM